MVKFSLHDYLRKFRAYRKKHFRNIPLIYSDYDFTIEWFAEVFGYFPDLHHPKTFNEKLNWSKLFQHQKIRQVIADKYEVRKIVRDTVGDKYLSNVFQVAERFNELKWDEFPSEFVVKPTHLSGRVEIVREKKAVNLSELAEKCKQWLRTNYYYQAREWCYKHIQPRLLVEELLMEEDSIPKDYKFFCFSGKVKAIQIDFERFANHKRSYYDPTWKKLPFSVYYETGPEIQPPENLDEMIGIAERLSIGFDFIRVDLYDLKCNVIFGELTNYPEAGLGRFMPQDYDEIFGSWWRLPGD